MTSLSIIGVGRIGGETAFLSSYMGLVDELILHDIKKPLLNAQVKDLKNGMGNIDISTDTTAIQDTDICVFTAGMARNPAIKTRADLLDANLPVADACSQYLRRFGGILITVVNPADVMNYYIAKKNELDPKRCIGFGGQLDTTRFSLELDERGMRGKHLVLGEHGDHQVPIFSCLDEEVPIPIRENILEKLRVASMDIIKGKGGTIFGPVSHIINLISMIVGDTATVVPCSCILRGEYSVNNCSIGVPAKVGREGILLIDEWPLDGWEKKKFEESAKYLQRLCKNAITK